MDRLAVERALATYKDENCYIKKQTIKGHGMGVYATRSLTPGTEIGDYIGELLGSDEVRRRREAKSDDSFRFEVGDDSGLYVDPLDEHGRIKFVCMVHYVNEPAPDERCNCAFFSDLITNRMYIRTVREIPADAELLVSYGTHYKREYPVNVFECTRTFEHWDNLLREKLAVARESGQVVENADVILGCTAGPCGRDLNKGPPPKQTDDDEPICYLCGGEANRLCGPVMQYGNHNLHLQCASWSSEVYKGADGELIDVGKAVIRGRRLPCTYCKHKGSTIGCNHPACKQTFHFKCATEAGGFFDQVTPTSCGPQSCPEPHSSLASAVLALIPHLPRLGELALFL